MNKPNTEVQERIRELYCVANEIGNNVKDAVYVEPVLKPAFHSKQVPAVDHSTPEIPTGISPGQPVGGPRPQRRGMSSLLAFWLVIIGIFAFLWFSHAAEKFFATNSVLEQPSTKTESASVNTELAGPRFSIEHADGIYDLKSCATRLVYSTKDLSDTSDTSLAFDQLRGHAEKVKSKLHLAGTGDLYSPLDKNALLILKHESECRNVVNYVGIGITVSEAENALFSVAVVNEGSPAALSGMKVGDLIAGIDGTDTAELTLNEAVGKMKGSPGTQVKLTVLRGSKNNQIFRLTLTRAPVSAELTTKTSGWLAVHRDLSGRFMVGKSTGAAWSRLEKVAPATESWSLGESTLVISISRPSVDLSHSKVIYSFIFT